MTVGGDDLDSRRWRSDQSEGRLEPCPASPKEPIATSILLNSGRKREGERGGGAVARKEEEEGEERKEKEKMVLQNSGSFRFDSIQRFSSIFILLSGFSRGF
ncbi:hypothetical protein JCGZ_13542 [Jatropha curcas]|uniref:Uncharacterized protein n=1 Tax=Jatropha curcas TaxID=180498 RepID=A0A067KDK4_JATCU|nr:hypothetical protein JCGZ_13542 [Jatropha curcas]